MPINQLHAAYLFIPSRVWHLWEKRLAPLQSFSFCILESFPLMMVKSRLSALMNPKHGECNIVHKFLKFTLPWIESWIQKRMQPLFDLMNLLYIENKTVWWRLGLLRKLLICTIHFPWNPLWYQFKISLFQTYAEMHMRSGFWNVKVSWLLRYVESIKMSTPHQRSLCCSCEVTVVP